MTPNLSESTKNPNVRKPLYYISETLDVNHKTDVGRLGVNKAN